MADSTTAPPHDLLALRTRIDAIDRELLALLNRRAALAQEVGEVKKKEGSVVFRPEREAQVIDGLKSGNPGPLKNESVAPIWREIMSACRSLETPTRVAYLGPAGTFTEAALRKVADPAEAEFVSAGSVLSAVAALRRGEVDRAVVPIENSVEGGVSATLDTLTLAQWREILTVNLDSTFLVSHAALPHLRDGTGRIAAHEIMLGTPAIRNLIREAKVAQMYSVIQTGQGQGMQTLDQNLADLVRRNVISPAEARAKAKFPENFPG